MIDLDAYLSRIGYAGPREPTLATLRALQRLHQSAITFEAIDVLLGRGVSLDPAAIDAKLLGDRRGGYCFEQNNLYKRALAALGFEVEALIARTRWSVPEGAIRPRTHMCLRVWLDGAPWLADVGYGSAMLSAPIRLNLAEPQETCFEPRRVGLVDGEYRMEVLIAGAWLPVTDIVPAPQLDADFITPNWYTSTHPASPFRNALIVARAKGDVRYALLQNRFTVRPLDAPAEKRRLSADELERCLVEDFDLPYQADWRPVLERAVVAGDGI